MRRHRSAKRNLLWFWTLLLAAGVVAAVALTIMGPRPSGTPTPSAASDTAPPAPSRATLPNAPAQPGTAQTDTEPGSSSTADRHMRRCLMATEDPDLCDRLAATLDTSSPQDTAPAPTASLETGSLPNNEIRQANPPGAASTQAPSDPPKNTQDAAAPAPAAEDSPPQDSQPARRGTRSHTRKARTGLPDYSYGGVY